MKTVAGICLAVKYWTGENKINHVIKTSDKIKIQTHFSPWRISSAWTHFNFFISEVPQTLICCFCSGFFSLLRVRPSLGIKNRNCVFSDWQMGNQSEAADEEKVLSNYQTEGRYKALHKLPHLTCPRNSPFSGHIIILPHPIEKMTREILMAWYKHE